MKTSQSLIAILIVMLAIFNTRCKENAPTAEVEETIQAASIEKVTFGTLETGENVDKYLLKNSEGMEVDIITLGGIITRWTAPDKNGAYGDVVLGFNDLETYLKPNPYFGALIGRYGNRIAKGAFSLNDETYQLATNDGSNHLHGGAKGFDKVLWQAAEQKADNGVALALTYTSADGEEGYPGNLDVTVTYTLTNNNELQVVYEAKTDKTTVVNLTQHSYFNLSGDFSQTVLDHEIVIDAATYLPVDSGLIPTGELRPVASTPFDFTQAKTIGQEINAENEQLARGQGYDHCWVLNNSEEGFRFAASAYHPQTGRLLEIHTDEPGIQFYSGNFLDGTLPAKGNGTYAKRSGFCLETQHYPDSPNQSDFPSVVLKPGETYKTTTSFTFLTK